MTLLGGMLSVKAILFLIFSVFSISALGYILGRITIKGINLGTAGVFIFALIYGCFYYNILANQLSIGEISYVSNALKLVENLGLILFVSSVGFIAGPSFIGNFKKNYKSYVLLGIVIILSGALATVLFTVFGRGTTGVSNDEFTAILTGVMAGSLTSTPAFSAAKASVASEHLESLVSVGYGIAYLFGVIGVVLFVQIMPKIMKADMKKERGLISISESEIRKLPNGLIDIDDFGLMPFSVAAVLGMLIGSIKFGVFSLTTTGGCLLVSLLFGHFGHIGKISLTPKISTLKVFREFGLMLFLIGAGVSGGSNFIKYCQAAYFFYGVAITVIPMIVGFFIGYKCMKLNLLNVLGSITGGMTSTPALGTLINVSGTEDVANSYAATYPIALISVVVASQLIIQLFS